MSQIRTLELSKRLNWLIGLRWFAVAGVIVVINVTKYVFNIPLPYGLLYILSGLLTISNVLYTVFEKIIERKPAFRTDLKLVSLFAKVQIFVDLIMLSLLIYVSGGVDNPFMYYFIFHMMIASMLLSQRWAFIQATMAMSFFGALVIASHLEIIPRYSLYEVAIFSAQNNIWLFVIGKLIGLISTVYILVFLATSISQRLQHKEDLLERANENLKAANEEKSKFILQVTHELRAPLAAVQNYLKVALEGYMGPIEGKLNDMLHNISTRTGNMLMMVNELLDLASLKGKKSNNSEKILQSFEEVLNKQLSILQPELTHKQIVVEKDIKPGVEIFADAEQLNVLLANLLNNAIKYSHNQTVVKVTAKQEDSRIVFSVQDQGIGIPEKDHKSVFQEFYRTQAAVDKEKVGTGLGLAIVNNIVHQHKGKIWIESEVGKGTTFCVELPL